MNRYIPTGYSLIAKDERFGFEVWGKTDPRIVAIAFGGKRSKPDWHFQFQSMERLHQKISESLSGYMAWQESKEKRAAQRKAPHDVKVGDLFRCSWGYDQTNIDYFECTAVHGAMIEIRAVAQEREETEFMQGKCVPMRGEYIGEPMRKRVSMAGGEPSVSIYSFASAYRLKPAATVLGAPVYGSDHWTAYA
jgi:hypothetical protein